MVFSQGILLVHIILTTFLALLGPPALSLAWWICFCRRSSTVICLVSLAPLDKSTIEPTCILPQLNQLTHLNIQNEEDFKDFTSPRLPKAKMPFSVFRIVTVDLLKSRHRLGSIATQTLTNGAVNTSPGVIGCFEQWEEQHVIWTLWNMSMTLKMLVARTKQQWR